MDGSAILTLSAPASFVLESHVKGNAVSERHGSADALKNRAFWDGHSDDYQAAHGSQLNQPAPTWGVWAVPEDELRVLGDVAGLDVLELGCGGGQWSIRLAARGARSVGLDVSQRQLWHARRLSREEGVRVPLVQADGGAVPFADGSFDIVFCDHGAMTYADPRRTVPEAARLLRPGGLFAFNMASPLADTCWNDEAEQVDEHLHLNYFEGLDRYEDDRLVAFQLPYGGWIRLFGANGLQIEDLIELRPPSAAPTTYGDFVRLSWALKWPAENIWKARKLRG